jgi:sugar lactone lactonase YvrE
MSELLTTKITDRAGTGSPNFSQGLKISGTDSGLLAPTRTEGATQPDAETSSNGDTFYDTANDTYDILIGDAWVRVIGAGGAVSWTVDLSNVTYDSVSFSVSAQEGGPSGIAFNTDGTKMYMVGTSSDSVHQYSLSTAFDMSTASYDSVSIYVSSQDTVPYGLQFSVDGTKMYMVGLANKGVYQYSLSTAFDLSTASYSSVTLSVSAQDASPVSVQFNTDGTKMYMIGINGDSVYQYSLSTGFDLSTASYDSVTLSVSSQDTSPFDISFNTDGTKMYMVGSSSDRVHQYSLSTGFDLSTASYDSVSVVLTSVSAPSGIEFNTDGTKMYIIDNASDNVYQYSTGL